MSNIFDNPMESVPFEEQGQNAVEPTTEESVTNVSVETSPEPTGQDAGTENVGTENLSTDATEPEWKKEFATEEEMYQAYNNTKKSYEHIRPKLTQTTQELSKLKKQATNPVAEPNNTPQYQQPVQQQAVQQTQSAEEIVRSFIEESNRPVVEQMEQIMLTQEVNNVANKYKDFDEYSEKISKTLEDNPALWNVPNAIENAYKLAKFDSIGNNIDQAIQEATKQAYAGKQLKVLGTGNTAQPSTQQLETKQVSAEEQAANEIVASVARKKTIFF